MPQNVSDLCQYIAEIHIKNNLRKIDILNSLSKSFIEQAEQKWVKSSFLGEYMTIYSLFCENEEHKVKNRNNYILFGLKEYDKSEFSSETIQAIVSRIFQQKADKIGKRVVGNYLKELSDTSMNCNILVEKRKDVYKIKSYKTLLCMRMILQNIDGHVVLKSCDELS